MALVGRQFGLASAPGSGVFCGADGLVVGDTPLLEKTSASGRPEWHVRSLTDINRDLSESYGLPVELAQKVSGLGAVAAALTRGDFMHAQIATLHLQFPDPPTLAKADLDLAQAIALARKLEAAGLLKTDWNPAKHPRWPAKSPDSVGGQFSPAGTSTGTGGPGNLAQIAIPFPVPEAIPLPGRIQIPSEVLSPPITLLPRGATHNPYPERRECVEEWADASEFCENLRRRGLLGKGAYRGMGRNYDECVRGQVSEDCGGNQLRA